MSDLKGKILGVISKTQLAGLATIFGDGKPWVRYVMMTGRDDFSIRCATFVNARKVAQIKNNSEVHINCGVNSLSEMQPYLQIQGKAELVTTQEEKTNFWNPELAKIFKGEDDPNYGVIVVKPYRIEYMTPGEYEPQIWTS